MEGLPPSLFNIGRDRARLSEYSEIVEEHGLQKARKFLTPQELRLKFMKQTQEKGLQSVLPVCS